MVHKLLVKTVKNVAEKLEIKLKETHVGQSRQK